MREESTNIPFEPPKTSVATTELLPAGLLFSLWRRQREVSGVNLEGFNEGLILGLSPQGPLFWSVIAPE